MNFLQYMVNGVSIGAVYAIIALGLPWFTVLPKC